MAEEARKETEACMRCARDVMQAERLVSREVLREVGNCLAESIERLGDRLDNLFPEVVTLRRDRD